ncbi:MAG TPA: PepSY-like domain-containing protein [Chryseolinea sp.]|nr:PepSY-like domain-containing protein [Chryseolinea sp.]
MKTFILFIFAAGYTSAACTQDIAQADIPSLVLNSFQSKFSNARDVEWERKGALFKVEFEIANRDHDLWLDEGGNIKKHKEELSETDLPAAIKQKLNSDFKEYRVDDVDKIETEGKVIFQVDLDGKSGDREEWFSADGTMQPPVN